MSYKRNGSILRAAVFVLALVFALPSIAFADQGRGKGKGRGKGRGKPSEVFVNGHDARDGRWDKRGRKNKHRDRDWDDDDDDDRDDDDDDYRRRGRRGRDRDRGEDDRIGGERGRIRDIALRSGYEEGYAEGRNDRANGERFNYRDESEYRDATIGYRNEYGSVDLYRRYFRQGFERGYREGYENRSSRRGAGGVLGDIFGIP